jgi:hypothetical protein
MLVAVLLLPGLAFPAPQSERRVCEVASGIFDAPSDAFDFFIGDWRVLEGDDEVASVSVSYEFEEKVLALVWESVDGPYQARSYLGLDEAGRWSQIWVDASSTPFFLFYHGGIEDGVPTLYQTEMYHESEYYPSGEGEFVCARQRYIELTADSFTYTWELSADQGKNWAVHGTDLTFRRR